MNGRLAACWAQAPGLAVGALFGRWAATRRNKPNRAKPTEVLTDADRAAIEMDFATHRTAVIAQMTEYADVLAGHDPVLRARLRKIVKGRQGA